MSCIYLLYLFLLFLLDCCHCLQLADEFEYLRIRCRDNSNDAVDWWYVYKPPSDVDSYPQAGINFSYITPALAGRWTPSHRHIYADSMLRYTLAPMFAEEFADSFGLVVYQGQEATVDFKGSASLGVLMAYENGGVWIGHTVPGFPNLSKDQPTFPPEEIKNGHIIMCLAMDLPTLNMMAVAIKQTEPKILKMFIPDKMKTFLPDWANLLKPLSHSDTNRMSKTSVKQTKILPFVTREKSLRGIILARSPRDNRCLYESFAKTKDIVMDVYGHTEHNNVICNTKYSLRNINSISLKYPEEVYYINNKTDNMGFAVSTAATWQRTGKNDKHQYWTCTGNIENQLFSAKGGIIACVTLFDVWLTFDNLKIKEPECE